MHKNSQESVIIYNILSKQACASLSLFQCFGGGTLDSILRLAVLYRSADLTSWLICSAHCIHYIHFSHVLMNSSRRCIQKNEGRPNQSAYKIVSFRMLPTVNKFLRKHFYATYWSHMAEGPAVF